MLVQAVYMGIAQPACRWQSGRDVLSMLATCLRAACTCSNWYDCLQCNTCEHDFSRGLDNSNR